MSARQVRLALKRALARVPVKRLGILLDIVNRLAARKGGQTFYADLTGFVSGWTADLLERQKQDDPPPLPATLKEFMESPLGAAVMDRLRRAKTYILIAESEAIMSETASIFLGGDGLKRSCQVVGMAAVFTDRKPTYKLLTPGEALSDILDYDPEWRQVSEAVLVKYIVDRALQVEDK